MSDPTPYVAVTVTPTPAQLESWEVSWQDMRATGNCPRCEETMTFYWELDYVAMDITEGERSATRHVTCACLEVHPGGPEGKSGCGANWPARFYEDAEGNGLVGPPENPRLAAAARALDVAGQDAETRLRAAAEKWVAGVAAVLALFSIAGTVTGGKILEGLSSGHRESVVWLTVAAIGVAALAILFSYLAAYGWPNVVEMTDDKLLEWYDARRERLRLIAKRLRWAVASSLASIGLLTTAAALAWLNPVSSSTTILKVTDEDDSIVCGTLLSAEVSGQLRLRLADGKVAPVPLESATNVESVKAC